MDSSAPYVVTRYDAFRIIQQECPEAMELFSDFGLHCANCFMADYDTVENGALMHGMDEEQMFEMLNAINTELEAQWREKNLVAK